MNVSTGFVGTGIMGGAMAIRLLDAGYPLCVCDPNPEAVRPLRERGATIAASPREVADAADYVFTSLNTGDITRVVSFGKDGLVKGRAVKVHIEMSTVGPAPIRESATAARAAGIGFLDSPVSGGRRGAAAGTLATMVAGDRATFDEALPLLNIIAGKVQYVGEAPGLAQIGKIVNNMLSIVGIAAAAEVMAMGVKAGVDADTLINLINVSSGRNTATTDKFPASILTGRFDFGASLINQLKTMGLFLEETERLGVPTAVVPAVLDLYRNAVAEMIKDGADDCDASEVVRYVERLAGAEIRGAGALGDSTGSSKATR